MRCRSGTFELTTLQLEAPSERHRVAAGGNGRELVGSEAVGPPVMTRARTPRAVALQRPATRIGALGEGRPPIGIGSTDCPRAPAAACAGSSGLNCAPQLRFSVIYRRMKERDAIFESSLYGGIRPKSPLTFAPSLPSAV